MHQETMEYLLGDLPDMKALSKIEVRVQIELVLEDRAARWMTFQASPEMVSAMMAKMGQELVEFRAKIKEAVGP